VKWGAYFTRTQQTQWRASLYKEALKLAACGWTMIAAGVVRRCAVRIRGRRPIETIELMHKEAQGQILMGGEESA